MIWVVPTDIPEQQPRVEKLKTMEALKIAPLVVYLASDAARDVSGQIFAVRAKRDLIAIPSRRRRFIPLDRTQDVFTWDPI